MKEDTPGDATVSATRELLLVNRLEFSNDGQHVRWARDNKKHPRNWHLPRKLYDTTLILLLDFCETATSTAGAAAAAEAQYDYHIETELSTFCFVTLFLLGQVVGTVVFPSWSEAFGRKRLYVISAALSSICCLIVGVVDSIAAVVIGRFVGGLLAAIPYTVGGGSVEDMFNSKARTWVFLFWTIASNFGLATGPIISTYVVDALNWRWVFYVYAIALAIMALLFLFIRESRPSTLLVREVSRLRQETGDETLQALNHDHTPDFRTFIRTSLFRPAQLFCLEPLVMTIAFMTAFCFSLFYLFTEALQPIYEAIGLSPTSSSLPFLALIVGCWLSIPTRLIDTYIFKTRHRHNRPIKPEDKLAGLAIGAPIFAAGLWYFAWTIPPHVENPHWIVPAIPLVLVGYALNEFDTVLYGYLADSYLSYSASAMAAVQFMRSLLAGAVPLFTKQMFAALENNVAVTVLAVLATVFVAVPVMFVFWGERIRARSRFARYSLVIQEELGKGEGDL